MSNDNLLREVDEELRRDQLRKAWRTFGPLVIAAAVLVVLGVAGYETWNWWKTTTSAKGSDEFYAAIEVAKGTDYAAADAALQNVVTSTGGGYGELAKFREAALLAQQGKTDEAVAAYDAIGNSPINGHLRDMALLLGANLLVDKGDVDAVKQRVVGLITPDSPLQAAALEAVALTQYKAGKLDDAVVTFGQILQIGGLSQDVGQRTEILLTQVIADGGDAKLLTPPSSEAPATDASSSAEPSGDVSSSTAVDASTELDVTPPVSSEAASSEMASSEMASSEPAASSEASSSEVPVSSSAAPSSEAPMSSVMSSSELSSSAAN